MIFFLKGRDLAGISFYKGKEVRGREEGRKTKLKIVMWVFPPAEDK